MQKEVHGTYISVDTTRAAVESLIAEGYDRADITILSNSYVADDLMDATRCQVLSGPAEQKRGGLKSLFKRGDDDEKKQDPLVVYEEELKKGKIVVLVPEK